jgi:choline dehydrogenase
MNKNNEASEFDYVIVGAGSAGCVLAHRLSADPAVKVLLLEAGPRDWHPFIHMPAGVAKLVNRKGVNWDYSTEPEPELGDRRLWWPRGKVLGGSSSINAMCYIRGHRDDYDEWASLGADGWDWEGVLPYFRRAEGNARGADALHGGDGPLAVSDLRYRNPLSQVFIDAARTSGHPSNDDFNGVRQEGIGYYQVTQRNGARCSTAAGYLTPIRDRRNLTVVTGARVNRVLIERGRASGVVCSVGGKAMCYTAAREVLLSGGALNSPQLLMLSGVGPADHLRAHGIAVEVDAPDVGANLQDHLDICTLQRSLKRVTYDRVSDLAVAWNYYVHRDGPGTSNIAEAGGFVRSRHAPDARPDIQFHFVPALLDDHGRHRLDGDGYTLHACFLRPRSRGRVTLASASASDKARIEARYLSDADGFDLKMMLECARLSREIFAQPAFAPYRGEEIYPGADVRDEAGLTDFIRRKAETVYHPVGTCRMGSDPRSVLDPQLRVRGIEGLRVVDASVMPSLIGGNTNAPTVMIAERAADLILADAAGTARAA